MKILSNLSQPNSIAPLRRWWVHHWQQSVSLTFATLIVISLWKLGWMQPLGNGVYDTWARWQGPLPEDIPIVIVELDEASLRELDRSPWERQLYAPLIRHLATANPAVIVLDMLFPGIDPADADLGAAMAQAGQVVLAQAWDQTGRPVLTNPDLIQAAAAVGSVQPASVQPAIDRDGTTRWIPPSTPLSTPFSTPLSTPGLPALGIAAVQVFYTHQVTQQSSGHPFAPLLHLANQGIGLNQFPTAFIHYPIAAVLSGSIPLKNFQNKIVLVGMAANSTMPATFNQYSLIDPVDSQAALINHLLQRRFLISISEVKVAGLLLIANLLLLVGSRTWKWQQHLLLWLGASLGWLILGWVAFGLHYGLPIITPLLWLSLTGGLLLGTHVVKAFLTLRRNETRYMLMLEGFNGGIWDWDLKTNQFYFSPRWQQMLGYDPASLSDQPQEWFDRVHPLDRMNLEIALADYLQADYLQTNYLQANDAQNAAKTPFEQEYRLLHQDGNYRWMQSRGVAIRNSLGKVERLVGSQIEITAQKQAEEELWRSTFFDRLTDLPSWAGFVKHLQQAINQAQKDDPMQFAVLWLDLDQFKLVNNSLGSTLGDRLLVSIAERLTSFLSLNEVVARLGEDEFAILLRHIQDSETAVQVAQQIQQRLADPFNLDDHEVFVTGSIGIVLGTSHDRNPESLLRDAGTAMYRAKAMGRSSLVVFDKNMRTGMLVKLRLESDLRRAIAEGERQSQILRSPLPEDTLPALATAPEPFTSGQLASGQLTSNPSTSRSPASQVADVGIGMRPDPVVTAERYPQLELYYQPIVQLDTEQVRGFEALVRWQHAEQGLLFPSRFISMAEETGLIIPLSWWVLRTACRQMNQWRQLFPDQDLTMSVNLSSKQFAMPGLTEQIHQILRETDLKPAYLKLELTESMVMENMDSVVDVLDQLQASGIRLAIDDFGTGYSSLSYLPRFPITTLKIDRSFIDRIGHPEQNSETNSHLEIIRTILTLARNLQMDVVAEGIETETQATYLREMGCEYGQGFFFHKPLDVHSATALLSG